MGGRVLFLGKELRWSWEGGGKVEEGKSCLWSGGYWGELSIWPGLL